MKIKVQTTYGTISEKDVEVKIEKVLFKKYRFNTKLMSTTLTSVVYHCKDSQEKFVLIKEQKVIDEVWKDKRVYTYYPVDPNIQSYVCIV